MVNTVEEVAMLSCPNAVHTPASLMSAFVIHLFCFFFSTRSWLSHEINTVNFRQFFIVVVATAAAAVVKMVLFHFAIVWYNRVRECISNYYQFVLLVREDE